MDLIRAINYDHVVRDWKTYDWIYKKSVGTFRNLESTVNVKYFQFAAQLLYMWEEENSDTVLFCCVHMLICYCWNVFSLICYSLESNYWCWACLFNFYSVADTVLFSGWYCFIRWLILFYSVADTVLFSCWYCFIQLLILFY